MVGIVISNDTEIMYQEEILQWKTFQKCKKIVENSRVEITISIGSDKMSDKGCFCLKILIFGPDKEEFGSDNVRCPTVISSPENLCKKFLQHF